MNKKILIQIIGEIRYACVNYDVITYMFLYNLTLNLLTL